MVEDRECFCCVDGLLNSKRHSHALRITVSARTDYKYECKVRLSASLDIPIHRIDPLQHKATRSSKCSRVMFVHKHWHKQTPLLPHVNAVVSDYISTTKLSSHMYYRTPGCMALEKEFNERVPLE